MMSHALITDV